MRHEPQQTRELESVGFRSLTQRTQLLIAWMLNVGLPKSGNPTLYLYTAEFDVYCNDIKQRLGTGNVFTI